MSDQSLADKFNALDELGALSKEVSDDLLKGLAPHIKLRPYQVSALERFFYYMEDYKQRPNPTHLLFHMATGSGKTVLMAALLLYLYKKGHRNFLFFVNSTQIIEKTKDNFLNPVSAKYLFSNPIRLDDDLVEVRSVESFEEAVDSAINIHFTTIQGLHTRMLNPRENAVTFEDFESHEVVMISDEAHHLNAETKKKLTKGEVEEKQSWEGTVSNIFSANPKNILLEFTATVDLSHVTISEKYHDKILYDYALKEFREDGYSKDIDLRQAELPPVERMLQAIVLSQFRRKVAESHGLHCKPVVLMKSRVIAESSDNEKAFYELVDGLDGNELVSLRLSCLAANDKTLIRAFDYIFDERGVDPQDLARELKIDFSPEKVINVNNLQDLQEWQIQLNSLEDHDNEIRVIFAVDKLNEGWDVLNLFDIVRLYDKLDSKGKKVGKTTMAEAQLIGRGARYYPFKAPDKPEAPPEKRKYDLDNDHPLRYLEQLHYHCSHNPKYIQDIRNALRETGMLPNEERQVSLRLKDSFKDSEFYQTGHLWVNRRIPNPREGVKSLEDYLSDLSFTYSDFSTGKVTEVSAFAAGTENFGLQSEQEPGHKDYRLCDFGTAVLRHAADANPFYSFSSLVKFFPKLKSCQEFFESSSLLGGVKVKVRGPKRTVENLSARQKVVITRHVLHLVESGIKNESADYIGTKEFEPQSLRKVLTDKTMKLSVEGESGRSWKDSEIEGINKIDLGKKDWHVFDDSFGTDQEKHFIRYVNDHAEKLKELYDEFYLVRNEKMFTLYRFDDGRAFEPDFVLFLSRDNGEKKAVWQLFIEPKGQHLQPKDAWKEEFLRQIAGEYSLQTVFQGRDYVLWGLPFYNEQGQMNKAFQGEFDKVFNM